LRQFFVSYFEFNPSSCADAKRTVFEEDHGHDHATGAVMKPKKCFRNFVEIRDKFE
jgi:hypothetical protein